MFCTGLGAQRSECALPCWSPASVLAANQLWLFRALCDSPSKARHSYFVVATSFTRVLATCTIQWAKKWRGSWTLGSAQRSGTGQGLTAGHMCVTLPAMANTQRKRTCSHGLHHILWREWSMELVAIILDLSEVSWVEGVDYFQLSAS